MIHRFEDTIMQMIRSHRTRMENFSEEEKLLSPSRFAEEYGTFQIDPGRQTGKTEFILKNISERDYVFLLNSAYLRHVRKRLFDIHKPKFGHWVMPENVLHTLSSLDDKLLSFHDFEKTKTTIWVDESKFLTQSQKENLYTLARDDYTTQFIFIG